MFAARFRACLALALLVAGRPAQAAPPESAPAAAGIQFDVVIVELRSPLAALIPPSHPLTHDQFPLAGLLASPRERASYLNYLDRLEKRMKVIVLSRTTVEARSGERATARFKDERAVPPPVGVGSIGVQFEEFGVQVDLTPALLADGTVQLDVATELTSAIRLLPVRRAIRGARLRAGETLLLAGPEDRYGPYGLLVAAPDDRYLFLITPRFSRPATSASLSGAVRDSFRSLDWQFREIQAEIETWWDDWRAAIEWSHDLSQLRAARRNHDRDDPGP